MYLSPSILLPPYLFSGVVRWTCTPCPAPFSRCVIRLEGYEGYKVYEGCEGYEGYEGYEGCEVMRAMRVMKVIRVSLPSSPSSSSSSFSSSSSSSRQSVVAQRRRIHRLEHRRCSLLNVSLTRTHTLSPPLSPPSSLSFLYIFLSFVTR